MIYFLDTIKFFVLNSEFIMILHHRFIANAILFIWASQRRAHITRSSFYSQFILIFILHLNVIKTLLKAIPLLRAVNNLWLTEPHIEIRYATTLLCNWILRIFFQFIAYSLFSMLIKKNLYICNNLVTFQWQLKQLNQNKIPKQNINHLIDHRCIHFTKEFINIRYFCIWKLRIKYFCSCRNHQNGNTTRFS